MTTSNEYLLIEESVLKPTLTLSIESNKDTINYINEYNKQFITLPPRNKIDTKIQLLKSETLRKLELVTVEIETIENLIDQLPVTRKRTNIYYKMFDLSLTLLSSIHYISSVYHLESIYPLSKKIYKTRYGFKREIVKRLNKAKRELNKIIKIITKLHKEVDKLRRNNRPPVRLVLNSNDWLNGIIENKYNRIVNPEAVETNNTYGTVEEKRKIKDKIRKQI